MSNNNSNAQNNQQQQQNNTTTTNPITPDQIEAKLQQEQNDKIYNAKREEQMYIKMRTEMQGFEYTPPQGFENDPVLQATVISPQKLTGITAEPVDTTSNNNNNGQPVEVPQGNQQQQSINPQDTQPKTQQNNANRLKG